MDIEGALAVAELISVLHGVQGRTRLQKIVHLLRSRGARDFKQNFMLHYYGPFSRRLVAQLDFLCAAKFVDETPDETTKGYMYRVRGDEQNQRISQLRASSAQAPPWAELAKQLDYETTDFLEALSTLVFLGEQGARGQALEDNFSQIKPHLKKHFSAARTYASKNLPRVPSD